MNNILVRFQENCPEIILSTDSPFKRLDHYKLHEYTRKWNMNPAGSVGGKVEPVTMTLTNNIDTMFKRKRGRPPKNRVVEVRINVRLCKEERKSLGRFRPASSRFAIIRPRSSDLNAQPQNLTG